jgi:hypothetical protein
LISSFLFPLSIYFHEYARADTADGEGHHEQHARNVARHALRTEEDSEKNFPNQFIFLTIRVPQTPFAGVALGVLAAHVYMIALELKQPRKETK